MPESTSRYAALDACVHCGFCLPACPTYLATGDENDSPRGRIVLMRALERGEIGPRDPSLRRHLDACLGCRGCEPVCPSGVAYGRGLEAAREDLVHANGLGLPTRAALRIFRHRLLWTLAFGMARALRDTRLAARLAGRGRLGLAMGMVAGSGGNGLGNGRGNGRRRTISSVTQTVPPTVPQTVPPSPLFPGCVMSSLFSHVHRATRRTLAVNGIATVLPPGTACCGALHAHAGDVAGARALAARNVAALDRTEGPIIVNSAGCGAMIKEYGHLLGTPPAHRVSARARDVSEVLADAGPRPGASLPLRVAYDPPCHLLHAQRIQDQVLALFEAIPDLTVRQLPGAERCCGSAGIFSLSQPEMGSAVLRDKIEPMARLAGELDVVATGNPGCLMQIGAGLRAAGLRIPTVHPVELLDRSYALAGCYDGARGLSAGPSARSRSE